MFARNVLYPSARVALSLEDEDRRREHVTANVALSGMLFSHFVHEPLYPSLGDAVRPYDRICINQHFMSEQETQSFEEQGGPTTPEGRRIGFSAMGSFILNALSVDSVVSLEKWAMDIAPMQESNAFVYGFGLGGYAVWDAYTDMMDEQGRSYYPEPALLAENDTSET